MSQSSSSVSKWIDASPDQVYAAIADPDLLVKWQAPNGMSAHIESFDFRVGGGYRMVLAYDPGTSGAPGKSAELEDRYSARFVEIEPGQRVVQAISFETTDPAFMSEMTMDITLTDQDGGTEVVIAYQNLPAGVRPEDNDEGTRQSLAQLAALFDHRITSS